MIQRVEVNQIVWSNSDKYSAHAKSPDFNTQRYRFELDQTDIDIKKKAKYYRESINVLWANCFSKTNRKNLDGKINFWKKK